MPASVVLFSLRIPMELNARLEQALLQMPRGCSKNRVLNRALINYLDGLENVAAEEKEGNDESQAVQNL